MAAIAFLLRFGLALLVALWPATCSCSSACARMRGAMHGPMNGPMNGSGASERGGSKDCCGSSESREDGDEGGTSPCSCASASKVPLELGSAPVLPSPELASLLPHAMQCSILRAADCARGVIAPVAERAPPLPPVPFLLVLRI